VWLHKGHLQLNAGLKNGKEKIILIILAEYIWEKIKKLPTKVFFFN